MTNRHATAYESLPRPTRAVCRILTELPVPDLDELMTAASCNVSPQRARYHLALLRGRGLLKVTHGDPPPLRRRCLGFPAGAADAIRERTAHEDPEAQREGVRRLLDFLLAQASAAERLLTPTHRPLPRDIRYPPAYPQRFSDLAKALRWLESYTAIYTSALRAAAGLGEYAMTCQLAHALWPLLHLRNPEPLREIADTLGLEAARRTDGPEGRLALREMLNSYGVGERTRGRYRSAITATTEALGLARQDGDRLSEAQHLHDLGVAQRECGDLEPAREHLEAALALRRELDYTRGVGLTLLELGHTRCEDAPRRAMSLLFQAHHILTGVDDPFDAARAHALIGRAVLACGDQRDAAGFLQQALETYKALGIPDANPCCIQARDLLAQTHDTGAQPSFPQQPKPAQADSGADDSVRPRPEI
ncbi:tetratricopeptide repeat protein [Streptomyces sp. PTM05]|uniref:Tetratricopeptide repeat protein n=1 Tax=Streptantibioticus parmotrematis TaxID=2873249 RepID=A0ABS7QY59_9ACTN|nr:tetratricopeptide repeat protein [Streptantibioticus parmotrematis]MBY8887280.1 tetratricopeptide repeat protein [Streptantibioticus parmotrematis]